MSPSTETPCSPSEDYARAGSGTCEGDHGGAAKHVRRKSGKYAYLCLLSVRKVKYSSVGLEIHLLFLADCCCKNNFGKTTKDLAVTCMVA